LQVKATNGLACDGHYLKLLHEVKGGLSKMNNDARYTIMFGPDKCAATDKVRPESAHAVPRANVHAHAHAPAHNHVLPDSLMPLPALLPACQHASHRRWLYMYRACALGVQPLLPFCRHRSALRQACPYLNISEVEAPQGTLESLADKTARHARVCVPLLNQRMHEEQARAKYHPVSCIPSSSKYSHICSFLVIIPKSKSWLEGTHCGAHVAMTRGFVAQVHLILQYQNPVNKEWEEKVSSRMHAGRLKA
jgi:hypothetical protein